MGKKINLKVVVCILLTLLIASLIILLSVFHIFTEQEDIARATLDQITVDKVIKVEYNFNQINFKKYISNVGKNVNVVIDSPVSYADKTGLYDVVYTFSYESGYGKKYVRTETSRLNIADTQYPIIELSEDKKGILKVHDVVDGPLNYSENEKSNSYTIIDNKVIATDKHGNKSTEELSIDSGEKQIINLDNTYNFMEANEDNVQALINEGYLVRYYKDFYHLNTREFLKTYKSINVGDIVIINNVKYVCLSKQSGHFENGEIVTEDGTSIFWNNTPELITNDGEDDRFIMFLEFVGIDNSPKEEIEVEEEG